MTSARSTSITKVFDVLLANFPAKPTDRAVDTLREELLSQVEAEQPRAVIIDISRVTTLDSFFARVIAETAQMVQLLGGEPIIVGVRPSVAITAAQLGYTFDDIPTARDVDHALQTVGISVTQEPQYDE